MIDLDEYIGKDYNIAWSYYGKWFVLDTMRIPTSIKFSVDWFIENAMAMQVSIESMHEVIELLKRGEDVDGSFSMIDGKPIHISVKNPMYDW